MNIFTAPLRALRLIGGLFALVVLAACGGDGTTPSAPTLAITTEPASATVLAGATATFTVQATGSSPTYQWRRGGNAISGATASSYTTPAAVAADTGATFSVVVTSGTQSVTSANATLTVNVLPTFSTSPTAQSVTAPATASFTVAATGQPTPTLKWQSSPDGTTWTDIAGATAASYTTPATATTDSGTQFRAVATNAAGSVNSSAASLTVTPARGPVQWQTATKLFNSSTLTAQYIQVGGGPNGQFIAVWYDNDAANDISEIRVSRYAPSTGWSASVVIATGNLTNNILELPKIAMNANGDAVVVWHTRGYLYGRLTASYSMAGGPWSTGVDLPTVAASTGMDTHAVVLSDSGLATVAWDQSTIVASGTAHDVMSSSVQLPSANWGTSRSINLTSRPADSAPILISLAANGRGDIVATWTLSSSVTSYPQVVANLYHPSTSWGVAQTLVDASVNSASFMNSVDINASGTALIGLIRVPQSGARDIASVVQSGPAGWAAPVDVSKDATAVPTHLVVSLAADGSASAAWTSQKPPAINQVFTSRQPAGGSWSTPVVPLNAMTDTQKLFTDSSGTTTLLGFDFAGAMTSARLASGGSWAALNSMQAASSGSADSAISSNGDIAAVWSVNVFWVPWGNLLK